MNQRFGARFHGSSLILLKEEMLKLHGLPDTIVIGGSYKAGNQIISFDNYFYKSFKFSVVGDNAQMTFIDLRNSDIILEHPKIRLSKNTRIEEIRRVFPVAYDLKNSEMNSLFGWDSETQFKFKRGECEWIKFRNGLSDKDWRIELTFNKGKLAIIYLDLIR